MAFGLAEAAKLAVDLSLHGNFSSALNANKKALSSFDAQVSRTGTRAYKAGTQIGQGFLNVGKLIAVGAGTATAGLIGVLKVAGDFEAQLNTINTIAHANSQALGEIGAGIRKIATDTGTPLADLTQGYYDLLSAGIKVADAQKVLTAANTLAIGGLATTKETVDLLTTAINAYGQSASSAGADADIFAKAIERGKVTAAELAASFSTIGPIAAAAGIGLDEVSAAYARLTASGASAGEAATEVRSAILAITKVNPNLKSLQDLTHKNYLNIASKQGLVVALQALRTDAAKAHVPLTDLVGRVEALSFILQTTGPNFAKYQADLKAMGTASGTAAAQMAERQKGLNTQLAILRENLKDVAITIGSEVLPKITPLFQKLNAAFKDSAVIDNLKKIGDGIAGLFSDENVKTGIGFISQGFEVIKAAAPVLQQTASATLTIVKAAVGLFTSLPVGLQQLAVGAFAVNKLTGGLVTNIAGGLASLLSNIIKSKVVNVAGAVVNVSGGVPGVAGVPGAAGEVAAGASLLSKAIGLLPATFFATGILAAAVPIGQAFASALPDWLKGPGGAGKSQSQIAREAADQAVAAQQNAARVAANAGPFGPNQTFVPTVKLDPSQVRDIRGGLTQTILDRGGRESGVRAPIFLPGDTRSEGRATGPASVQSTLTRVIAALMKTGGLQQAFLLSLHGEFRDAFKQLSGAKTAQQIKDAIKSINKITFDKGIGGSGGAAATEKTLRGLLKEFPSMAKILLPEIRKVHEKVLGRQFEEGEFRHFDQIFRSSESNAKKIKDLQRIATDVGRRDATNGARLQKRVDAVRAAAAAAGVKAADAIRKKDLSVDVRVNLNNKVVVNNRSVVSAQRTYSHFYNVGGAAGGDRP